MANIENPDVFEKFQSYPEHMRQKLFFLRQLVIATALETKGVGNLEETLKWGEPSYTVKGGSSIRMAWKQSCPNQYAMYFHCKTTLVDTFRELYRDTFKFEGNRAIIFYEEDVIPVEQLKHCIILSLKYHQIKHLPMLGI